MNRPKWSDYKDIIFDMDGTLVDSMPYWRSLGRDYLAAHGIEGDDDLEERIRAMTVTDSARYFQEHYGLQESVEEIIRGFESVMEGNYRLRIPAKPGAKGFLTMLKREGLRLSVCSATGRPLVEAVLSRLELRPLFDQITSCEEAGAGKDSPAVFKLHLKRLQRAPGEVLLFEDADFAVCTAVSVGIPTAAVYDPSCRLAPEEMQKIADFYVRDFTELM